MTPQETRHIDEKFEGLGDMLAALTNDVSNLATEVKTIKRGVYGDKENSVKGLIDRIKSIENLKLKIIGFGGGSFTVLEFLHWLLNW